MLTREEHSWASIEQSGAYNCGKDSLSGREPKEVEELKEGRESVVLAVGGRKGGFWKRNGN